MRSNFEPMRRPDRGTRGNSRKRAEKRLTIERKQARRTKEATR